MTGGACVRGCADRPPQKQAASIMPPPPWHECAAAMGPRTDAPVACATLHHVPPAHSVCFWEAVVAHVRGRWRPPD